MILPLRLKGGLSALRGSAIRWNSSIPPAHPAPPPPTSVKGGPRVKSLGDVQIPRDGVANAMQNRPPRDQSTRPPRDQNARPFPKDQTTRQPPRDQSMKPPFNAPRRFMPTKPGSTPGSTERTGPRPPPYWVNRHDGPAQSGPPQKREFQKRTDGQFRHPQQNYRGPRPGQPPFPPGSQGKPRPYTPGQGQGQGQRGQPFAKGRPPQNANMGPFRKRPNENMSFFDKAKLAPDALEVQNPTSTISSKVTLQRTLHVPKPSTVSTLSSPSPSPKDQSDTSSKDASKLYDIATNSKEQALESKQHVMSVLAKNPSLKQEQRETFLKSVEPFVKK